MNAPRQPVAAPQQWQTLPGVPRAIPDFMEGESRQSGTVAVVPGWDRWGDAKKLRWIRQFAESYGRDPHMRWKAVEIFRQAGVQPRDWRGQAQAILSYVQGMYYTNEPGEQIQSPWRTMAVRTGDCDDLTILAAALAESVALPWRLALAGRGAGGRRVRYLEGQWIPWGASMEHIYLQIGWPPFRPQQWASAEPTVRGLPLGHDVVLHGVPGEVMPEFQGAYSGYGAVAVGEESATHKLPWYKRLDGAEIAAGVISGVAISVGIGVFAPLVERLLYGNKRGRK